MDNNRAGGGEYNSADISQKPKLELITNIVKSSRLAKIKQLCQSNQRLFILSSAALLCAVLLLATTIYLLFLVLAPDTSTGDTLYWQDTVEQIRSEVEPIDVYAPGDDYFAALGKINAAIQIAEASGSQDYVHELQLIKADFLINNAHPDQAVEESLIPQYEIVWDEHQKYEILRRLIQAFDSSQDYVNRRTYTEIILKLPDSVLGDSKDRYRNLLETEEG